MPQEESNKSKGSSTTLGVSTKLQIDSSESISRTSHDSSSNRHSTSSNPSPRDGNHDSTSTANGGDQKKKKNIFSRMFGKSNKEGKENNSSSSATSHSTTTTTTFEENVSSSTATTTLNVSQQTNSSSPSRVSFANIPNETGSENAHSSPTAHQSRRRHGSLFTPGSNHSSPLVSNRNQQSVLSNTSSPNTTPARLGEDSLSPPLPPPTVRTPPQNRMTVNLGTGGQIFERLPAMVNRQSANFQKLMGGMFGKKETLTKEEEEDKLIREHHLNKQEQAVLKAINSEPTVLIDKFMKKGFDLNHLKTLNEVLDIVSKLAAAEEGTENAVTEDDCKYTLWLNEFLDKGGLDAINDCLASSALISATSNISDEEKELKEVYCLKVLETILNSSDYARKTLIKKKDLLRTMVLVLDSKSLDLRAQILLLLSVIMNLTIEDIDGYELIMDAFTNFKLIKREPKRFHFIVDSLNFLSSEELDVDDMLNGTIASYVLTCLVFFNSLITVARNEGVKIALMRELRKLDLHLCLKHIQLKYEVLQEEQAIDPEDDDSTISNIVLQIRLFDNVFHEVFEDVDNKTAFVFELDNVDTSDATEMTRAISSYLSSTTVCTPIGEDAIVNAHDSFINIMNSLLRFTKYIAISQSKGVSVEEVNNQWKTIDMLLKAAIKEDKASFTTPKEIELDGLVKIQQRTILDLESEIKNTKKELFQAQQEIEKRNKEEEAKKKKEMFSTFMNKVSAMSKEEVLKSELDKLKEENTKLQSDLKNLTTEKEEMETRIKEIRVINQRALRMEEFLKSRNLTLPDENESVTSHGGSAVPPPPGMGSNIPPPPGMNGGVLVPPPPPGSIPMPPGMNGGVPPPPGMTGGVPPPPPGMNGVPPPPPGSVPMPPGMGGGVPMPPGAFGGAAKPALPKLPTVKPKKKTKVFFFDAIPSSNIQQTIFIKNGIAQKTNELIAKMDLGNIEETFEKVEEKVIDANAPPGSAKKKVEEVILIDGKRSNNISIQFSALRKLDASESDEDKCKRYKKAIIAMDEKTVDENNIEVLTGCMPLDEEIKIVKDYLTKKDEEPTSPTEDDGVKKILPMAETFFTHLLDIPSPLLRLQSWEFKLKLNSRIGIRTKLDCIIDGCKELQESTKLHDILAIILTIGNYINQHSPNKKLQNLYGFKISSLEKMSTMKGRDPKQNMLQFLVQVCEDNFPDLISVTDELKSVGTCTRLQLPPIDQDIKKFQEDIKQTKSFFDQMCKLDREGKLDPEDRFISVMEDSISSAQSQMEIIVQKRQKVEENLKLTAALFDEKAQDLLEKPDVFFNQIYQFLDNMKKAQIELKAKREKEEKEQQKKAQEEAKKKTEKQLGLDKKKELLMQRKKAAATTTATKLLTRTVNLTPQSPSYDISTKTKNSLLSTISLKSPIPEQEEPSHLLSVLEKQQEEKKKSNNFFAGLMQMSKKEEKPIERRPTLMSLMAKGLTDGSLMKAKQEKKMY